MKALALSAIDLYEHSIMLGWWNRLWLALRGKPRQLLDLRDIASSGDVQAQRADGLRVVPIRQIQGTEGRAGEFDTAFHPIETYTEARWRNIAQAWLAGAELPPVDLIRVGEIYFVRDGHHRISVASALGQREIDALVTVWQVEQPKNIIGDQAVSQPERRPVACRNSLACA
jgi:hypothetical protein